MAALPPIGPLHQLHDIRDTYVSHAHTWPQPCMVSPPPPTESNKNKSKCEKKLDACCVDNDEEEVEV